jgi:carboxyl-terminal processing protease
MGGVFGAAVFAVTALCTSMAAAQALSQEQRQDILRTVETAVVERYFDPALKGVDWASAVSQTRATLEQSQTDADSYDALKRLVGQLNDAHTRLRTPEEAQLRRAQLGSSLGLAIRLIEGQPVVTAVTPGSQAAAQGVKPGLVVEQIDGVPFAKALARAQAIVGQSSTPRTGLRQAVDRVFAGPLESLALLVFRDPQSGASSAAAIFREPVFTAGRLTSRRLAQGPLYIRFDRFGDPIAEQLHRALAQADARGVVLDLRNNGGGAVSEMRDVLDILLTSEQLVGATRARDGQKERFLAGLVTISNEWRAGSTERAYAGPLVVLVGPRTASAAEIVSGTLQDAGRAKLVGEPTCGCVLVIREPVNLPGGGELDISRLDVTLASGRRLEGVGLTPEAIVEPTLADITTGRDPALAQAAALLQPIPPVDLAQTANAP